MIERRCSAVNSLPSSKSVPTWTVPSQRPRSAIAPFDLTASRPVGKFTAEVSAIMDGKAETRRAAEPERPGDLAANS